MDRIREKTDADNIASSAKESKREETSPEEVSDQEKETVIQEVLGYMLGHRKSLASSSKPKEKLPTVTSDHQLQLLPSATCFQVCQRSPPKPLDSAKLAKKNFLNTNGLEEKYAISSETYAKSCRKKYSLDSHTHLDDRELKGVPITTSFSNRPSRYRERKRLKQLLHKTEVDRFIEQSHPDITPPSAAARARTCLTSGTHYWPRVLLSSDLNTLFSRLHADNATM